ncbi:hypothetical protein AB0896_16375 [Streptomyces parvulus]|uniref:hypothetical protein n=1 Tax=Streptomyces parvulus TaxID=146923 RepID=UPI00345657A2
MEARPAPVVTCVTAVLVAGGVFYGWVYLLQFQEIDTTAKLDAKALDLVELSFGAVAGAGALVAPADVPGEPTNKSNQTCRDRPPGRSPPA